MGKFFRGTILPLALIVCFGSFAVAPIAFAKEEQSKQKKKECEEAEKKAQQMCNDSAPAAQQGQQGQNQAAQNQGGSAQSNCQSQANSALPALIGALGSLQSGCQEAQADCQQKCGKAQGSPGEDCNDEDPTNRPKCQGTASDTAKTGSEDSNKCQQLDKNLAKIAQMLAKALADMAAAQQCQKQTNCTDPTFAAANAVQCRPAFNCNDPKSLAGTDPEALERQKKCQCLTNPRGCAGFESGSNALTDAAKKPKETTIPSASASTKPGSAGSSGSALGGPSTAHSGGLSGSGSGGGRQGAVEKHAGSARDGVNGEKAVQVNAGDYGGGAAGHKGGSGYPDPANPPRGPAGKKILTRHEQNLARGGMSGAYGRSNWDKIRERYRENHPTFTP